MVDDICDRWWEVSWWEDDIWQQSMPCALPDFRNYVGVLKEYFDEDWARARREVPIRDFVYVYLCLDRSMMALRFMAHLGRMLHRLQRSSRINRDHLNRKVRELKSAKSESAFFELEIAEVFAEEGFAITFPKEGGTKKPDVVVQSDNLDTAIECKRLREQEWEQWEESLTSNLLFSVPQKHQDKNIAVNVTLNPRISELKLDEKQEGLINREVKKALVTQIGASIQAALADKSPPFELTIAELATVSIAWQSGDNHGSVMGADISSPSIIRRLLTQGVMEAAEQLPKHIPGIIAIYVNHSPEPQLAKLVFDAVFESNVDRFGHVTCIAIFCRQTIFNSSPTYLFLNISSRYEVLKLASVSAFCRAIEPIILT